MEEQKKKKYAFWLNQDTKKLAEDMYQKDNCQSQSEFVENAIRFYAGYISTKDATEYLVPVLTQVLRGLLEGFASSKSGAAQIHSRQGHWRGEAAQRYADI